MGSRRPRLGRPWRHHLPRPRTCRLEHRRAGRTKRQLVAVLCAGPGGKDAKLLCADSVKGADMTRRTSMSETNYPGVDYSGGTANFDKATGIHYGVICAHDLSEWALGDFEADYG